MGLRFVASDSDEGAVLPVNHGLRDEDDVLKADNGEQPLRDLEGKLAHPLEPQHLGYFVHLVGKNGRKRGGKKKTKKKKEK